jgi:integrase
VGLLKSILSQAVDQDLIGSNPAARLKKPVPPAREAQVVDAKAIEELRAAMSPRYRCMVDLMGWAGLRIGEVAGLKTTDLKRGRVQIVRSLSEVSGHITEQPPKARQKRAVTLPPMVVERLRAHIDAGYPAGGWLFPAPGGGPLRLRNWRSREWVPATKAVGLPGLTPHSLRHSHVAVLASQGVPIKTAADRLGHSSPTVTLRVYSHTFPSVEAAVVDGLQEAITEAAKAARPRLTAVPD